ncbi:MAG: hypothetical protein IPJ65_35750 [Archangiaceae bacterium]|nr:hypothetical protein [Archangiaceae bacterium]
MRHAAIATAAVLLVSIVARLAAGTFSLYLEPFEVARQWHLWQLFTWVPAGASLTFLLHAPLVGFAVSRGASVKHWLGATFISGLLTTLLAFAVPALFSCTFTGAGVGATAALGAWAATVAGPRRLAATALALLPAVLDALVDGLYVLLPFAFALLLATLWVRRSRRPHSQP